MKYVFVLVVIGLGACKGSTSTTSTGGTAAAAKSAEAPPAAGSADEVTQVSTDVHAAMTELGSYTERLYKIMREATDCDAAAKQLEELVPVFQALGPRMMKVKERLMALPPADRDRIKQQSEDLMQAMTKRFADADAIEQKGKACGKSSAAFAAIAPKVMFVKAH